MKILIEHQVLLLFLLLAGILMSVNLNKPFTGHHDYNGAWHSMAARNFLRYGLIDTRLASVMNADFAASNNFSYYTHYPPLVPILIAASFKLFGIHEWSARIVPLFFSLLSICLIYVLAFRFFGKKVAVLSAAFSSVIPLVVYFGKTPTHDIISLPFVLTTILFYFNFFKNSTRKNYLILVFSLLLSHLTHWSGYYPTPLFFLHYLLFSKSPNRLLIASSFPLFSLFMFLTHLLQVFWITGEIFGGGLLEIFLNRTSVSEKMYGYSLANFLNLQSRFLVIYFTRPVLLFSLISSIWVLLQIKRGKINSKVSLISFLAIFGFTPIFVFRNLSFIHDYIIISTWPFFAVSASFGFFLFAEKLFSKNKVYTFAALILLITSVERLSYTKALLLGNGFQEGVTLGTIINQRSKSGEKILVLSPDFKRYYEVFTDYYSSRIIDYSTPQRETLERDLKIDKYKLIVAIPSRDTPEDLTLSLKKSYKETKIGKYLIYENNVN